MEKQVVSKVTVVALVVIILVGAGVWSYLEFSADILVSRDASMDFAADFEKRCQGSFEPEYCLKFAGMHHSSCFRSATRPSEDGARYDEDAYFKCMDDALNTQKP